ncbi:MAG: adenosylcobinamide-phosphate synthase CbiB [Clostridiales bacterium]|jgi:adenosylcobinamide-phosphate synthase|nr:adenosylcobinamide-phosphate synthase CbiB [Clostridiales bacterium]
MIFLVYLAAAITAGFILDMIFGDPYNFPHIVRFMGKMIAFLEKVLRRVFPKTEKGEKRGGILLVLTVSAVSFGLPLFLLLVCYRFCAPLGFALESFLCYQLLAAKSLKTESMKVYGSLQNGSLEEAKKNLSMIVGRDTKSLSVEGIIRAAVETVAENTSDGVTAPLFFIMLGGAAAGCLYKAVNTMDSMVGYKNEKYLNFGRFAAKTDDAFNFIPSRLCAILMISAAYMLRFNGKAALRVWRRDRLKHASPNSAQTESVCAGALEIRLAGPASYGGKIYEKEYIGDDTRQVCEGDIISANRLMYATSVLTLILAVLFRVLVYVWSCLF